MVRNSLISTSYKRSGHEHTGEDTDRPPADRAPASAAREAAQADRRSVGRPRAGGGALVMLDSIPHTASPAAGVAMAAIRGVGKTYPVGKGMFVALHGIDLDIMGG